MPRLNKRCCTNQLQFMMNIAVMLPNFPVK